MSILLLQPESDAQWREARRLVEEYAASLDLDLSFQSFAEELAHFTSEYASPAGAFLLAQSESVYVGCVGVRKLKPGIAEVKRLYVIPGARDLGVGRLLAEGIIAAARDLGYRRLLLDTLPSMKQAQALYRSLGFEPVPPYRFNPVPGTAFLALDLA